MTYRVSLTLRSKNEKTGRIPVSTTTAETCPTACPLEGDGCYAEHGPLAMHWHAITEGRRGVDWDTFCDQIAALPPGTFWRHNQAGDLPGDKVNLDAAACYRLSGANARMSGRGFTYTHYDVIENRANRVIVSDMRFAGFTVNLSANGLAHADALAATHCGPVVTILPADSAHNATLTTPAGRKVVVCPATYRDDVTCDSCRLCAVANRDCIVGFPVHGTAKRKAQAVFTRNGVAA